jgi:hypothetical protein
MENERACMGKRGTSISPPEGRGRRRLMGGHYGHKRGVFL